MTMNTESAHNDFIRSIITADLQSGEMGNKIVTRFPPEPNGHLHIGHAKSICLNFGVAAETNGTCHLRFDDTNPTKEEHEYIDAIQEDVRWLGFDWDDRFYYASDYFERLYTCAVQLIKGGNAYVDDLTVEEVSEYRGRWNEPGRDSPYRSRSVRENLDLFGRMRSGEFEDGSRTLRAKIDMAAEGQVIKGIGTFGIGGAVASGKAANAGYPGRPGPMTLSCHLPKHSLTALAMASLYFFSEAVDFGACIMIKLLSLGPLRQPGLPIAETDMILRPLNLAWSRHLSQPPQIASQIPSMDFFWTRYR